MIAITCATCRKRKICKELCEQAEAYASQDARDESWSRITIIEHIDEYSQKLPPGLSTCEAILQEFFIERLEPVQIAEKYHISKQYVHRTIKKYSGIMKENIKKSVYSHT